MPPDFNLRIGGTTFAVEITALFTQYVVAGRESVSEASIWKAANCGSLPSKPGALG